VQRPTIHVGSDTVLHLEENPAFDAPTKVGQILLALFVFGTVATFVAAIVLRDLDWKKELSTIALAALLFWGPIFSGETFYIHDKNSSTLPKPLGWFSLKTMEDEINHLLSRAEAKFCTPNGATCSKTIGLLVRRHIVAGEFHYIGKEASTRWASGPEWSMMAEAGALDPTHETFREYERVVDAKYLEEIRAEAKQFSTKLLSRQSRVAECAIRNFKKGKNTIKHRTLRRLTRAIHDLQNIKTRKSVTFGQCIMRERPWLSGV